MHDSARMIRLEEIEERVKWHSSYWYGEDVPYLLQQLAERDREIERLKSEVTLSES